MSVLAADRAQYQASQNQKRGATIGTAGAGDSVPLGWSTADDRAYEETVV